ncbi:hypothetical protein MSG28_004245 [Choristoneura fumiferana]|uniref:Uncharacterized protein n=1 Tax=Choristoneura fumiferana TaxID=7141 RepID=A0ACC0KJD2_CHOFU|nr:hypothetical protein MSG28_004245 [Choristoneura fumiferana]
MPRQKSIKTIIAEALMLCGMVVVVGHMATNFWERFMLKSELTNMKTSLYTLKDAVNNIGTAYDNLYKELQVLTVEGKIPYKAELDKLPKIESSIKHDEAMQSQSIAQAQASIQARNMIDISTTFDKAVEDFIQQCKSQPVTNISTITSKCCPFSPIGLGLYGFDKFPNRLSKCFHKCYNSSISDELFYPVL